MDRAGTRPSQRVYLTAIAAVGLLMLLAVLFGWVIHAQRPLAGTNSVAPRFPVAGLQPGQRLCITRLPLPGDANTVEMALQTRSPTQLSFRLSAGGREQVARARVPSGFSGKVAFPVRASGRDGLARACLSSRAEVAAVLGVSGGTSAVTSVNGAPLNADVSVWFLRLPGRNVLSALPDAPARATLFRAGFVGAWTYWLLLVLVPALWLAGLRLLRSNT